MKLIKMLKDLITSVIDSAAEKVVAERLARVDNEISDLRTHQKKLHKMTYHLYYPYSSAKNHPYNEEEE